MGLNLEHYHILFDKSKNENYYNDNLVRNSTLEKLNYNIWEGEGMNAPPLLLSIYYQLNNN